MELDLNDVKTFVAVAQAGTFSAAAKELGVPTSTVSRAMTRLEESIGISLCERSHRGLVLTDPGREYLTTCKRAFRSLRDGHDLLEQHRSFPGGLLRIACPETLARDVLAPILIHLIEAHPALRVEIEPYASGRDYEPREEVDVFFKLKTDRNSSRKIQCFPGTARALFSTAAYLEQHGTPGDPTQLGQHRCIGSGIWKLTKGKKVLIPDILFHVVANDPAVHLRLACEGVGIASLPLWMAKQADAQKVLRPVLAAWKQESVTICALYTGSKKMTPKVRAFLNFVAGYIGTDLDPRLHGHKPRELFTDLDTSTTVRKAG